MAEEAAHKDEARAMVAAAWIMFFLIIKNVILLIVLAVQRRQNGIYRVPEDATTFGATQKQDAVDDWSLAGRIQRVLANDAEYIPYFFALMIFIFASMELTHQHSHHYLSRVLGYGIPFTIGRFLHTIGYLIGNSYGRIAGFLITIVVLTVIAIDQIYYTTSAYYDW